MKKIVLTFFVLKAQTLVAQPLYYADQQPMIVMTTNASSEQVNRSVNLLGKSILYSVVSQRVSSQSGDQAFFPLVKEGYLTQFLNQVSFFDLAFQKNLSAAKIAGTQYRVDLIPFSPNLGAMKSIEMPEAKAALGTLGEYLIPMAQSMVKLEKPEVWQNQTYLNAVRTTQQQWLLKRFPNTIQSENADIISKVSWLLTSYTPISFSAETKLFDHNKKSKFVFLFPALGVPRNMGSMNMNKLREEKSKLISQIQIDPLHLNSKPVGNQQLMAPIKAGDLTINEIQFHPDTVTEKEGYSAKAIDSRDSHEKSRVVRIVVEKNLKQIHTLGLSMTFGYLPQKVETDINETNVDLLVKKRRVNELADSHDFGLMAKGELQLSQKEGLSEKLRLRLNQWLRMFEVSLSFHKVSVVLNRWPIDIKDLSLYSLDDFTRNSENLDMYMNENIGFRLKNMTFNPDDSLISVRIKLKPEYLGVVNKDLLAENFANDFCAFSEYFSNESMWRTAKIFYRESLLRWNKMLHPEVDQKMSNYKRCEVTFLTTDSFKKDELARYINSKVKDLVQAQVAMAFSQQLQTADERIDQAIIDVTAKATTEIFNAKEYIHQMKLPH